MANSLGTLNSAIIIQRALELVFTKRPLLKNISLGFKNLDGSVSGAKLGQEVLARIKTIPTVGDFGDGPTAATTTDVPVTLDQEKEIHHEFTREEYNGTDRQLVDEAAEPMAVALANHMVDAIAALWVDANFSNNTTVASAWTYTNTLVVLRKALQSRGAPEDGRFFVANSDVYAALLTDPVVVAALNNPANGNAIQTGKLPMVAGLAIDEYPSLPSADNLIGFAGTPDSTVYAARAHKDPREILPNAPFPGNFGIVTEPKTGLSIAVTEWIDAATLNANVRLSWIYGVAKGNANNGQILNSAD